MVHIHNGILLSHKKECIRVSSLEVDEPIIQSEVSQKEKGKYHILMHIWASLVAQLIKNPPAMRETSVQSLGWEDALEKGKSTRSSNLALRIPWTV